LENKIGETGIGEVKRAQYEKRIKVLSEQQEKLKSARVAKPIIKNVGEEDCRILELGYRVARSWPFICTKIEIELRQLGNATENYRVIVQKCRK
jgi:hypothetical protein